MKKNQDRKKKVLLFGTFDGIHKGHIFLLKQACKFGSLTIALASDAVVKLKKNKTPRPEKIRARELRDLKIAKKIIVGDKKTNSWNILQKVKPDIIAVGYDQKKLLVALKRDYKKIGLPFIIKKMKSYYPRKYHSSIINK